MTVIATDTYRLSNLVKHEYKKELNWCRDAVIVNDAASTYAVGTVLGKVITSGTATAAANAGNTGTGTFGTITVTAPAKVGVYSVVITTVAANAGTFLVVDPNGVAVGTGTVAVAFSKGGLAFTISDATDFVIGDGFSITVLGTYKYKISVQTATDGSQFAAALVLEDKVIPATTDTKMAVMVRGPASVSKTALVLDATHNTDAEKAVIYASLAAMGIQVLEAA